MLGGASGLLVGGVPHRSWFAARVLRLAVAGVDLLLCGVRGP